VTVPSGPIRVLLADDHAPTREDVRFALEQDGRFVVCAEAGDVPGAIEAAVRERPDVCVLDLNMPGWGVAGAWEIRARLPQAKLLMLTVSRAENDLFAALRAGVDGYLLKDMDPRALPRTLLSVMDGQVAIPRELMGIVVEEFRDRAPRRRPVTADGLEGRLTSREWEVLTLLRQGLSTAQVAQRMCVSPVTVRTHLKGLVKKLEVSDRQELLERFTPRQ
jgi:DNA-binding NarL/FixJ family response regulator